MIPNITERVTLEQFEAFIAENDGADYELIGGEIVKVLANSYSSQVAAKLLLRIGIHVETEGIGHFTGADGGYAVGDERYLPDVGFITKVRQLTPPTTTYIPLAPDLAVEVKSPSDREKLINVKISNYLAAGTTVWMVYPEEGELHVHRPNQQVTIYTRQDTLVENDILQGVELKVAAIFPPQASSIVKKRMS